MLSVETFYFNCGRKLLLHPQLGWKGSKQGMTYPCMKYCLVIFIQPCAVPSICQVEREREMGKTQIALLRLKPGACKTQAKAMEGDGGAEVRTEVGEAASFPGCKGSAAPALLTGSAAPSLFNLC